MTPGVLFDLDGTLLDHRTAVTSAINSWATERVGADPGAGQDVSVEWFRLETLHFSSFLRGEASFQEQRQRRMAGILEFLDLPAPQADDLDRLFEAYLRGYEAAWTAFDDVEPTLDFLASQGVPFGVLTNGDEGQQRSKLRAIGVLDRVSCVVASSTLPAAKPSPSAFLAACERLGKQPGSVYYVGDSLDTDALAATAAGLHGVWLNRLEEHPDTPPEAEIVSLREVAALLG